MKDISYIRTEKDNVVPGQVLHSHYGEEFQPMRVHYNKDHSIKYIVGAGTFAESKTRTSNVLIVYVPDQIAEYPIILVMEG